MLAFVDNDLRLSQVAVRNRQGLPRDHFSDSYLVIDLNHDNDTDTSIPSRFAATTANTSTIPETKA